jgi:hypothetical protein
MATRAASGSRPTSSRRTRSDIETIKNKMFEIISVDNPMTVRQVFYRMVAAGAINKTETEYKSTVVRLLGEMRRAGDLPYGWIADNTRWMRKPTSHRSLDAALRLTAETYRRALWDNQEVYVEIWLEKDALSGVLLDVTGEWDVPLMVTRGYPSLTFLHSAAAVIGAVGKPTHIYYFGDHDPSGVHIPQKVEADLRKFAPHIEMTFERVAVTTQQITAWDLPTRPTKPSDTRAKSFDGESVEVDAIPPSVLRELAAGCINQHIDDHALNLTLAAEDSERQLLAAIANGDFSGMGS